ncbi:MAG: (2Fe-2S)-binding protein [Candidatus Eisenbacteria bacterium]|nr:(2Fe-2S)-binding protein [Candidatus Eisenbacteria bacterium]
MALKVTIDNRTVEVEPGTTVLNAASQAGVYIPHLCYHRKLSIKGSCRLCLIEVEGTPKLQPACSTLVCDGMRVKTDTQQVKDARRAVLELLLLNHPLDCPVCDAGGECKLQDYVFWYGRGRGRFVFEKRTFAREDVGPFVSRDMNRCIHCTRCARFAAEVSLAEDIGVFERGDRTWVGPYPGKELRSPFSGNVTELCPVGALTDRVFRFKARSWELTDTPSSCPLCPVGCPTLLQTRDGRILRIRTREKSRTPWICDLGRFGFAARREETRPTVMEDGRQIEVPWDVAAQMVAGRLRTISKESGPESIGVVCGTLATNEELFALQHVFRNVLKCGSVSFGPRTPAPASHEQRRVLEDALRAQGRAGDLVGCDSVLLLCADPYEEAPVAGLKLLQALGLASSGAGEVGEAVGVVGAARDSARGGSAVRITALGPRRPEPPSVQTTWIAATPQDCADMVKRLALELANMCEGTGTARTHGDTGKAQATGGPGTTGTAGTLKSAAVEGRELGSELGFWSTSRKLGIVVGGELVGSSLVYGVLASVLRVCAARSALGVETVPLFLFGSGNARGALELGVLAGQSRAGSGGRGDDSGGGVSDGAGFREQMDAAAGGKLRALFVFGLDPLAECYDRAKVEEALKKVDFLCVQSDTVNETAGMAHVYLPLQSVFGRKGSFVDLEGRLTGLSAEQSPQGEESLLFGLLRTVCEARGVATELDKAEAIFSYMKGRYGWNLNENLKALSDSEGVFPDGSDGRSGNGQDVGSKRVPARAASRDARAASDSVSWKRPPRAWLLPRDFEGEARAAGRGAAGGSAGAPVRGAREPGPPPQEAEEFVLLSGRAGVSRSVWARDVSGHPKIPKSLFVEISRADAERLEICEGESLEVTSALGSVRTAAVLSESLMPGAVFVPFGFPGPGPGVLAGSGDEVTVVRVRKVGVGAEC